MFFYLSFLRPLPRSSNVTNTVSITPQIASDLRTSHLEEAIDIFYSWSLSSGPPTKTSTNLSASPAVQKLTTWRISSMYKNISIPLPQNASAGQEWRLSLCCTSPMEGFVIDLGAKLFGNYPFPVTSMPVRIDAQGGKIISSEKQEQIERLYSIPVHQDTGKQNTVLCIREQTSFELDKKIWDSGLGLSSWITNIMFSAEPAINPSSQQVKTGLSASHSDPLRVVELGTGTGIVSICLSACLELLRGSRHAHIFATDLPSAMELIEHNISANRSMYPSIDLQFLVLDWDDETLPPQVLGKMDFIIMADVTYNTASFNSLVRTLERLVQSSNSSGRTPCLILAYKQRDPEERTLWSMLRDVGIDLSLVDQIAGSGAEAVEVWVWKKAEKSSGRTAST